MPTLVADEGATPPPTKFGDQVTGDHFIKGGVVVDDEDPFFPTDTVAVVLYDRATKWLAVYPKTTKTTYHTMEAFQRFGGPRDKIKSFYCDNAPELISAARGLHWRLSTATTGMPQTNGVAERQVRAVKEGGGAAIVKSGLNPLTFWPEAGEHYCFSVNIALVDGDSSYHRRHKNCHFKGAQFPFGAMVDFMPQPDTKVVSMGAKTIPGVFIGYRIQPGGLWSGDYLVADLAPFREDCDVAKSKVKIHRIKEVLRNRSGLYDFPVAQWRQIRVLRLSFDEPDDPDEPKICSSSDDDEPPPQGGVPDNPSDLARSSTDGLGVATERSDPLIPTDIPPAEMLPPKAGALSANGIAPGTDTRGMGLETFEGRGSVRGRKGVHKAPNYPPRTLADNFHEPAKTGDRRLPGRARRRHARQCRLYHRLRL